LHPFYLQENIFVLPACMHSKLGSQVKIFRIASYFFFFKKK